MLRPNLTPNSDFFTLKLISCYNIITLVAYYFQNIRMMIMPKKYLYSITVATITFLTVSTYQVANGQEFVTDGLVLYYSFDKDMGLYLVYLICFDMKSNFHRKKHENRLYFCL